MLTAALAAAFALGCNGADRIEATAGNPATATHPRAAPAPPYAKSAWPTLHADGRNSDSSSVILPASLTPDWSALEGAAVLVGPTLDREGRLFVTTGRGVGTSHLHAFDRSGALLWKSAPQRTADDLDAGAVINAVVIDENGDLFVADTDQLWSFTAEGALRWVTRLTDHGAAGHLVTPILTRLGRVGGFTTQGQLILFDRSDGTLATPVLDLPGQAGGAGFPSPPGLFGGGLLDPELIESMWRLLFGWGIEVANTPAVDSDSGRIFVTASGAAPDRGVLYGVGETEEKLEIQLRIEMAGGIGTSPVLSRDGRRIYAAGDDGVLVAFDTRSGEVLWRAEGVEAAASPTLDSRGRLFSFSGPGIVCLDGQTGELLWRSRYSDRAEAALPLDPERGAPIARIDSILTATDGRLLAALNFGYKVGVGDQVAIQPTQSHVALIDASDGALLATAPLRDTSSALLVPDFDGRIYVGLSAISTSLFAYGLNAQLPETQRLARQAVGGMQAFRPSSARRYALRLVTAWLERSEPSTSKPARHSDHRSAEIRPLELEGLRRVIRDAAQSSEIEPEQHRHIESLLQALASSRDAQPAMPSDPNPTQPILRSLRSALE